MATNKTQSGSSGYLTEDLIRDILPRLPPRSLLRCRTVCKAWHSLATDRDIILNHHARQPAQPLLTVFPFVAPHNNCLEAVDLSTNKLRKVARFVERAPLPFSDDAATNLAYDPLDGLMVHASCDGLLLLSFHEVSFFCNPATRQGALLPLRDGRDIAGFYKHAASGEYRVLYHQLEGLQRKYCVLTLGYQEARTVDLHASSAAVGAWLARGLPGFYRWPPVLLHDCLHWPLQQSQDSNIVVFDPAAESFRLIAPPPTDVMIQYDSYYDTRLFEMESTLAMFCWRHIGSWRIADLWFLEDYEKEASWVCKHRVELPVELVYEPLPFYPAIAYPEEGDMLVPKGSDTVLHYDKAGQLQGSFECAVRGLRITPHMLKESLVIHEFLYTQQSGGAGAWFSEVQFAADGLPVTGLPS